MAFSPLDIRRILDSSGMVQSAPNTGIPPLDIRRVMDSNGLLPSQGLLSQGEAAMPPGQDAGQAPAPQMGKGWSLADMFAGAGKRDSRDLLNAMAVGLAGLTTRGAQSPIAQSAAAQLQQSQGGSIADQVALEKLKDARAKALQEQEGIREGLNHLVDIEAITPDEGAALMNNQNEAREVLSKFMGQRFEDEKGASKVASDRLEYTKEKDALERQGIREGLNHLVAAKIITANEGAALMNNPDEAREVLSEFMGQRFDEDDAKNRLPQREIELSRLLEENPNATSADILRLHRDLTKFKPGEGMAPQSKLQAEVDKDLADQWKGMADRGLDSIGLLREVKALESTMIEFEKRFVNTDPKLRRAMAWIQNDESWLAGKSLREGMAPKFKVKGSGSMSDREQEMLMNSLGSEKTPPEAREVIFGLITSELEFRAELGDLARKAQGLVAAGDRESALEVKEEMRKRIEQQRTQNSPIFGTIEPTLREAGIDFTPTGNAAPTGPEPDRPAVIPADIWESMTPTERREFTR